MLLYFRTNKMLTSLIGLAQSSRFSTRYVRRFESWATSKLTNSSSAKVIIWTRQTASRNVAKVCSSEIVKVMNGWHCSNQSKAGPLTLKPRLSFQSTWDRELTPQRLAVCNLSRLPVMNFMLSPTSASKGITLIRKRDPGGRGTYRWTRGSGRGCLCMLPNHPWPLECETRANFARQLLGQVTNRSIYR